MSYFLCNFRNQGKEIGEEDKPVCPGNEEPSKPSEEDKPVDPLTILEKRSRESEIILEDKPVSPGDEEPTKPSEEEKPVSPGDEEHTKPSEEEELVSPGDEEPTKPSTPVKLVEVVQNKGEVTIFKEKSKKKKWNPFKKSHTVKEKRREQQIVEYGDDEPTKLSEEEKPVCPRNEDRTYEEVDPLKIIELKRSHATEIILEDKPVSAGNEEPTRPSEEENSIRPGDENQPDERITYEEVDPLTILEEKYRTSQIILEEKPVCSGDGKTPMDSKVDEDCEPSRVSEDLRRTKNHLRVVSLRMKSFFLSFILAVIIFVGVKVAFPDVDLLMIGGMSMVGFSVSILVQQL